MKYLILWLITVRVIHLFILHNSYQGLNKEKIKQNYVNYIAILIKNIIMILLFTDFNFILSLIYMFFDRLNYFCEKIIDIVIQINDKRETLEEFIVSKIMRFIK